jgi:ribosomal protein S18 acetylase RimI-like enzyme
MREEAAGVPSDRLETVRLSADDVDAIFALYEAARTGSPYGHLAIRSKDDYRRLFADPDDVIATGVRDEGRLVAYSMCHRVRDNPYRDNFLLGDVDPGRSVIFHGDGTVVDPAYQGRRLGHRIFRLRERQMAERGIDHMVALVATDNLLSIGNALLSGAMLIGFARDETALNYLVYGGRLSGRVQQGGNPAKVEWRDQPAQERLFAAGHVACGLDRASPGSGSPNRKQDRSLVFFPVT